MKGKLSSALAFSIAVTGGIAQASAGDELLASMPNSYSHSPDTPVIDVIKAIDVNVQYVTKEGAEMGARREVAALVEANRQNTDRTVLVPGLTDSFGDPSSDTIGKYTKENGRVSYSRVVVRLNLETGCELYSGALGNKELDVKNSFTCMSEKESPLTDEDRARACEVKNESRAGAGLSPIVCKI